MLPQKVTLVNMDTPRFPGGAHITPAISRGVGVLPVFRLAVAVVDDLEALEGEEGVWHWHRSCCLRSDY